MCDPTISSIELCSAEYQESNAILIYEKDKNLLKKISLKEKCPVDFVCKVNSDGWVGLVEGNENSSNQVKKESCPVYLDLNLVLKNRPQKTFKLKKKINILKPLSLPENLNILEALNRVLRLPSVGSKRFLTNKVVQSITGLIAQQQCVDLYKCLYQTM